MKYNDNCIIKNTRLRGLTRNKKKMPNELKTVVQYFECFGK